MLTLLLAGAAEETARRYAGVPVARQTVAREIIDIFDLQAMRRAALAPVIAAEDEELLLMFQALGAL